MTVWRQQQRLTFEFVWLQRIKKNVSMKLDFLVWLKNKINYLKYVLIFIYFLFWPINHAKYKDDKICSLPDQKNRQILNKEPQ